MNMKDVRLQRRYIAFCKRRKKAMQADRDKEWSLAKIGLKYGVTRQRVGQILGSGK